MSFVPQCVGGFLTPLNEGVSLHPLNYRVIGCRVMEMFMIRFIKLWVCKECVLFVEL